MTGAASNQDWQRFLALARYARGNPLFESMERAPLLELAESVRTLLDAARRNEPLEAALDAMFHRDPDCPHDLVPPSVEEWVRSWANGDPESFRAALTELSGTRQAIQRFELFAKAVEQAVASGAVERAPRRALVLGSLLNFSMEPDALPVIWPGNFGRLEQVAGWPGPPRRLLERYAYHVEFARHVMRELHALGVPVDGMLDVQGLILLSPVFIAPETDWPPEVGGAPPSRASMPERTQAAAYLSICACLGYDAPYLHEWLEFHRLVGVEHFFLYNNGDRENQRALLEPYVKAGIVTLRDWLEFPPQTGAFNDCLERHRGDSRWIAFIDTDEFLFSPAAETLPQMLVEYEPWPALAVNLVGFGTSGHDAPPAGLVTENYLQRYGLYSSTTVKCVVDPRRAVACLSAHRFRYSSGWAVDENKYPTYHAWPTGDATCFVSVSRVRVNHYLTKSLSELRRKLSRLRPDSGEPYFDSYLDRIMELETRYAGLEDRTILRYGERLKAAVAAAGGVPAAGAERLATLSQSDASLGGGKVDAANARGRVSN